VGGNVLAVSSHHFFLSVRLLRKYFKEVLTVVLDQKECLLMVKNIAQSVGCKSDCFSVSLVLCSFKYSLDVAVLVMSLTITIQHYEIKQNSQQRCFYLLLLLVSVSSPTHLYHCITLTENVILHIMWLRRHCFFAVFYYQCFSYVCVQAANFTDADLPSPPVLDAVLEPGDLLYFPRGYIHQVSASCNFFLRTLNYCPD